MARNCAKIFSHPFLPAPAASFVDYAYNSRNLLEAVISDAPPPVAEYTYNARNQPDQPVIENGLVTIMGVLPGSFACPGENRLLTVTPVSPSLGDKAHVHSYDGLHRRVTRTTREWTSSGWTNLETTYFIYDGWNVIEEWTSTFSPATAATLTRRLTWGQDLAGSPSLQGAGGVGGLLMVEEITSTTNEAYHFHYDGNGNVTEITDHLGVSVATYRYDAFGNTLVATGTYAATNRYRFSTKPLDHEVTTAPLYYYGYRYLDPVTGRWPSRDPIEERGGVNLYGFVGNNGVNVIDLFGLINTGDEIEVKCGWGKERAGTILINDYSIRQIHSGQHFYEAIQASLDMTFAPRAIDDPKKCCCVNGNFRWYQTVTVDDFYGNTPYPDDGSGRIAPPGPNLAPSYDLQFVDRPSQTNFDPRKQGNPLLMGKTRIKFETELQCVEDGKVKSLKTIKWGFWLEVKMVGGIPRTTSGLY